MALLFASYVVELATFFAAAEGWKRYVIRTKHILTGDPNAERVPSKESDQEIYSQKSSSQKGPEKGPSQEKGEKITDQEEMTTRTND